MGVRVNEKLRKNATGLNVLMSDGLAQDGRRLDKIS